MRVTMRRALDTSAHGGHWAQTGIDEQSSPADRNASSAGPGNNARYDGDPVSTQTGSESAENNVPILGEITATAITEEKAGGVERSVGLPRQRRLQMLS